MDKTKRRGFMKRIKILAVVLALMMGLCVFSGCSDAEVKVGRYEAESGMGAVIIREGNEMQFIQGAMSYAPICPYTIKYNKLTFKSNYVYVFKIRGDQLILLSEYSLVEKGTVFTYEGE